MAQLAFEGGERMLPREVFDARRARRNLAAQWARTRRSIARAEDMYQWGVASAYRADLDWIVARWRELRRPTLGPKFEQYILDSVRS